MYIINTDDKHAMYLHDMEERKPDVQVASGAWSYSLSAPSDQGTLFYTEWTKSNTGYELEYRLYINGTVKKN